MANNTSERVACYIRVSTEEQKLHGISLDAQEDKLKEYAKAHNLTIVEWYRDEGVSGRKLIRKRPELQRMLNDAHAGKFDRIIFIKLDRFFRSVAEYHECMKYIDPVVWTATEEKYDLTTANGRAFVNMKLTIAELEADQTGERIKLVNEYKVKNGQALAGSGGQCFGYMVKTINGVKRVVIDPDTEPIVRDFLDHFLKYNVRFKAYLYVKEKYNTPQSFKTFANILTNSKYYGYYRGNPNYIEEPYFDYDTHLKLQSMIDKSIKITPSGRVYLFTGLIKCPLCNIRLTGRCTEQHRKKTGITVPYYLYACNSARIDKNCSYHKQINESKIENYLLSNLDTMINSYLKDVSVTDIRTASNIENINNRIASINKEMEKLKRMYRKEDITEVEYDTEIALLKDELTTLKRRLEPINTRDLTIYEELLNSGWKALYNALNRDNKRAFWRKYIKEIILNPDNTIKSVIFF